MERPFIGIEDLTNSLAEKKQITKKEAYETVKIMIDILRESLLDDTNRGLQLVNFLTLTKVVRKEKLARNPKKPKEEVIVPERNSLKVTVGKELHEEMNK